MNKILKFFVYTSLTIHLAVVAYELIRIFFVPVPEYLKSYDLSKHKAKYIRTVFFTLIKIFMFYIIVLIVNFKSKYNEEKEDYSNNGSFDPERRLVVELQNLNNSVQSSYSNRSRVFSNFIEKYKAYIAVYLYLIGNNIQSMNPVLFIIAPFFMYKIIYKLYLKRKYTKIFLWSAIVGLATGLYGFLSFKKKGINVINNNELPIEIIQYLTNKGYEVAATKIDADFYNVGVINVFKSVAIFIFGDVWDLFTEKEFLSILYHEIGHIMNKSLIYRMFVSKALDIILYIVEFIMIYKSRTLLKIEERLDSETNSEEYTKRYINNLICLYVIFCISLFPIVTMINNIVIFIDEIEADKFSAGKIDRKYLIKSLIKLTIENKAYFDSSLMFNFLHYSHPCLKRRIQIISNM